MSPVARRRWINQWVFAPIQRRTSLWRRLTPPQLFVISFLTLILLGTVGLKTLPGLYTGEPLGWVDALFTATSAVCVTGLIVVDTATYFTPAGKAFLLLLIQLGGLGIITFTTLIVAALGQRLSLRHEAITASVTEVAPHVDFRGLTRDVVRFTLVFEAIGALLLFLFWAPHYGWGHLGEALGHAVFHAVSAFCNAGFSTYSDSLVAYQRGPLTLLVVMILIVCGGLGFLTLEELYLRLQAKRQKRNFHLSLHSRLVLVATVVLLLGGWGLFAWLEWRATLGALPTWSKLFNALFMSVTARTAGFNTIDYAEASDSTNFLTILLMFVGGSPGSTAGGLKTTTMALIGLLVWSRLRGYEATSVFGRSVREETIQRAVGLAMAGATLVAVGIFVFTVAEIGSPTGEPSGESFLMYMFEATSAFNTVGLSMGATGSLSTVSKWATILLMFIGRVGLPTAAAALIWTTPISAGEFRYAYEDVVVG